MYHDEDRFRYDDDRFRIEDEPKPLGPRLADAYLQARFWYQMAVIGVGGVILIGIVLSQAISSLKKGPRQRAAPQPVVVPSPSLEEVIRNPERLTDRDRSDLHTKYGYSEAQVYVKQIPLDEPEVKDRIIRELTLGRPCRTSIVGNEATIEYSEWAVELGLISKRSKLVSLSQVDEEKRTVVLVYDRAKADVVLSAERREIDLTKRMIASCVAHADVRHVQESIKKHSRTKVVLVEVENRYSTTEARDLLIEYIRAYQDVVAVGFSPDGRLIEFVLAPADIGEIALRLAKYNLTKFDRDLRRITCRPDPSEMQRRVDERKEWKAHAEYYAQHSKRPALTFERLQRFRREHGAGQVAVVAILNRTEGDEVTEEVIYQRLKSRWSVLEGGYVSHGAMVIVVKVEDFPKLVKALDFGTIVRVDEAMRTVVVELEQESVRQHDPESTATDNIAIVFRDELKEWDLLELRAKYGERRVAQVRLNSMDISEVKRNHVRRVVGDGKESIRIYQIRNADTMLVAPIDDFEAYAAKFTFTKSQPASEQDQSITADVDVAKLAHVVEKKGK